MPISKTHYCIPRQVGDARGAKSLLLVLTEATLFRCMVGKPFPLISPCIGESSANNALKMLHVETIEVVVIENSLN